MCARHPFLFVSSCHYVLLAAVIAAFPFLQEEDGEVDAAVSDGALGKGPLEAFQDGPPAEVSGRVLMFFVCVFVCAL